MNCSPRVAGRRSQCMVQAEKFGLSKKRWFVLNDEAGVCAYYSSEGSTEEDMKGTRAACMYCTHRSHLTYNYIRSTPSLAQVCVCSWLSLSQHLKYFFQKKVGKKKKKEAYATYRHCRECLCIVNTMHDVWSTILQVQSIFRTLLLRPSKGKTLLSLPALGECTR